MLLENLDTIGRADRPGEAVRQLGAGDIAGVEHPAEAVPTLTGEVVFHRFLGGSARRPPLVERHPEFDEPGDRRGTFPDDDLHGLRPAQAGARPEGI